MENDEMVLKELLEFSLPKDVLDEKLKSIGWDTDFNVVLKKAHIQAILQRYLSGQLNSEQVEWWANAIESREDIEVCNDNQGVEDAIYQLANPVLTEQLSPSVANQLLLNLANR